MIGKTISHYKIVDKLGEGGMGAVYKAEDTTLRRLVALKVLSSQLAEDDEARKRFVREAQAASALNHSNITTVYELLEDEGEQFIVMEYIEGKTIRDIVESGHVSIRKALDIITQAAEALEAAHNKGILHRDVKSANIMVSMEGNVKVMDFGLAHLEERSQLTRTGTTMGTLAYSSPEQLVGSPVDRRSEIFSLGVVFYELLTGQLPFKSPSEGELVFEIINNEQDKPSKLNEDVPANVEAVVTRMLDKKPELRYQSCGELLNDLNAIRSELETTTVEISTALGAARAKKKVLAIGIASAIVVIGAIAVLLGRGGGSSLIPDYLVVDIIANRTDDLSLDSFGEQIAYEIARGISQAGLISVVPAEEVSRYYQSVMEEIGTQEERSNPLRAMVNAYKAGTAITGAIFAGSESTVEVRLNIRDMRTGDYIYSLDPITGTTENRKELLERIHRAVMGALALEFDPEFSSFAELTRSPASTEAFAEFREGLRDYYGGGTREEAIQHFYRASNIDSSYLAPLVWAARIHGVVDTRASLAAKDSLVAVLSQSLSQLTLFERFLFEYADARKGGYTDYSRKYEISVEAASLAPGTMWSFDAGQISWIVGRPQEALQYFAEVDPDAAFIRNWFGWCYAVQAALNMVGKHEEALELAREYRSRQPNSWQGIYYELIALARLGRLEEILTVSEESKRFPNWESMGPGGLLRSYAAPLLRGYGYHEEARTVLEISLDWYETERGDDKTRYRSDIGDILYQLERWEEAREIFSELNQETGDYYNNLGRIAARLGNRDEALMWSERLAAQTDTLTHNVWLNRTHLALIAALLGDREDAVRLLQQAIDEGQFHYDMLPRDMDFEGLWDYGPFQAIFRYFP